MKILKKLVLVTLLSGMVGTVLNGMDGPPVRRSERLENIKIKEQQAAEDGEALEKLLRGKPSSTECSDWTNARFLSLAQKQLDEQQEDLPDHIR